MLTPEEIRNIAFTKGMGGYKTNEVDLFIDQCADTVETLLSEKAELNKKLEILADKLVEYRNDEDSIRTALLSAQRLGDTVVREANHKAGLIMDDANIKAQKIVENARRSIVKEEEELRRIDPIAAEKLHLRDEKRIIRALEVWQETGRTITEHDRLERQQPPKYDAL